PFSSPCLWESVHREATRVVGARVPRVCLRPQLRAGARPVHPLADASAEGATRRPLPPQKPQLIASPDAVPTPAGWGVDAFRLPAVGPIVIVAIVVKERAHHPEPMVVVMAKVVMGKALPMEFASHATTASLAHMAFGKTSTDATAAMRGESSAAKAAGMAATP